VKDEDTHKAIELLFVWKSNSDLKEALDHVRHVHEAQPSVRLSREYDKGGKKSTGMEHPFGYNAEEEVRPSTESSGPRPREDSKKTDER
jgi:hypothetical protein